MEKYLLVILIYFVACTPANDQTIEMQIFIGLKNSKDRVFHEPHCSHVREELKKTKPDTLQFRSCDDANVQGYRADTSGKCNANIYCP